MSFIDQLNELKTRIDVETVKSAVEDRIVTAKEHVSELENHLALVTTHLNEFATDVVEAVQAKAEETVEVVQEKVEEVVEVVKEEVKKAAPKKAADKKADPAVEDTTPEKDANSDK